MPPMALEYQGRGLIGRFLAGIAFRDGRTYRLVATRGNGQLSFGSYLRDPSGGVAQANDLLVLTLTGSRISAMTRFQPSLLARFGLPSSRPQIQFSAPQDKVFDALTTVAGLASWWAPVTGSGAAGGELRFAFGAGQTLVAHVRDGTTTAHGPHGQTLHSHGPPGQAA